ncbi:acetylornithine deacetylase [Thozetella sp. PMI_491]|nr:acetylornithine deacetylase [Thozetella sp. PMI_491]
MELSPDLVAAIKDAVRHNFAKQVEFTQKIVRFGGQRGEETAVQDELLAQYASRGYSTDRLAMDESVLSKHPGAGKFSAQHSKAPVAIGIHEPTSQVPGGKSLILNGHIDVVPLGPEDLWLDKPYSGTIEGDWLYGRGSGDMRSGLVANLFALDALRLIGKQPASRVILESVPEEESTGNGTMATYLAGYTADAALIPEPTDESLIRANVGVLWFQIDVRGRPVHVLKMGEGSNAIASAWKLGSALQSLEQRMNDERTAKPHFEATERPINFNIAMIQGGDWASSVPAWCRIDCRIALYPGTAAEAMAAEIERVVQEAALADPFLANAPPKITWNGFFAEGYVLEPGSDAEKLLGVAHQHATQAELKTSTVPAYLDARVFALYNKIPALCYGPIGESLHGFDERVSLSSIERVTTSIALFIAGWCGLEDAV